MHTADVTVIRDALLTVGPPVYHFFALKPPGDSWLVWAEDGAAGTVRGDNRTLEQGMGGTVDLFTLHPEDTSVFTAVQEALDPVCAWSLESIQYEQETGLTHYEWRWEVA